MDTDNTSLRSKPLQPTAVRENLAKIDAELIRCRERIEDLKLMQSLGPGGTGTGKPCDNKRCVE